MPACGTGLPRFSVRGGETGRLPPPNVPTGSVVSPVSPARVLLPPRGFEKTPGTGSDPARRSRGGLGLHRTPAASHGSSGRHLAGARTLLRSDAFRHPRPAGTRIPPRGSSRSVRLRPRVPTDNPRPETAVLHRYRLKVTAHGILEVRHLHRSHLPVDSSRLGTTAVVFAQPTTWWICRPGSPEAVAVTSGTRGSSSSNQVRPAIMMTTGIGRARTFC